MFSLILTPLLSALVARAIITPTSPDSTTVVKVGGQITALWNADTTGTWTDVEIQLMTGDNLNMVALQTLTTGVDGTTTTSFSAPAPDVTPNAAIYFLQFSNAGNMTDLTWTTRFTIAAADGSTTQPTNSTTYNGTPVSWGTGSLVGTDSNSTSSSSNSTDTSSTSAIMSASTQSAQSAATTATGLTIYTSGLSSTNAGAAASSVNAAAGSASASASASASGTSGAGKIGVSVGWGMVGLIGAGLMLL